MKKLSDKELQKLYKSYFDLYPDKDTLYFTEDGNCFLTESPAKDHARKSEIKFLPVKRKDVSVEATQVNVKKTPVSVKKQDETVKKQDETVKKEVETQKTEVASTDQSDEETLSKKEAAEDWLEAVPSLDNVPYAEQVDKLQDILKDLKGLPDKKAETVKAKLVEIREQLVSKK